MNNYERKLQREREWYEKPGFKHNHFLNRWPFHSPERVRFSYESCMVQIVKYIREVLEADHLRDPRMLLAPAGAGNDLPYFQPLSRRIAGIDISAFALRVIPDGVMEKFEGDIRNMTMFKDNEFDVVIMAAFFHHFVRFGFDEFLREARRVLRPGGYVFSCEPSILHPFAMAAWCGKKVFGQITGCVEDETPFLPARLTRAMRRCGFQKVGFYAGSFLHSRMPIPLARLIRVAGYPLLRAPVFKHFGQACLFHGQKP